MSHLNVELVSHDGQKFGAYLATPTRPTGGSVVVLQEIFGINANVRSIADDFAAAGYYAIAPDLFWRQEVGVELNPGQEADREKATALLKGLDLPNAVADALIAADYAGSLPNANGKVAAVGYCLGGKLAYILATKPSIAAAASYYGVAIQASLDKVPEIKAPLLLHIAEQDHLCPPEAQTEIEEAMAASDLVTVLRFPGVGHAFARRGGATFDAASAERADKATADLLARVLA